MFSIAVLIHVLICYHHKCARYYTHITFQMIYVFAWQITIGLYETPAAYFHPHKMKSILESVIR